MVHLNGMMAAWRLSKMCSGHRKHNAKVFRVILKEDVKMAKGMSNSACIRIMPLKFSKMDSLEKPKMCIFDFVNTVSLHTASKTHILGFYKRSILENSETLSGCMRSSITPLANLTSSFIITRKILAFCFPCSEHILDNLHAAGWRKNATLPQRVETSRRRSRRCLVMSLALAKTSVQHLEIHELLALVYHDIHQSGAIL
ncbi:hypothetical protein EV1_042902 [Malus domestica]